MKSCFMVQSQNQYSNTHFIQNWNACKGHRAPILWIGEKSCRHQPGISRAMAVFYEFLRRRFISFLHFLLIVRTPSLAVVRPLSAPWRCLFFCLLLAFIRIIKHFISVDSEAHNFNKQQFHSFLTWILDSASFVPIKLRLCQQIDCHFTPAHIQT